jgi:hypothetical protein
MRHVLVNLVIFASASVAVAAEPNRLTDQEKADGWLLLFDGESLFGWRAACEADWQVVDGTIRVTQGEVGLLRTTTQFSDYLLTVQYRTAPATNSGLFLRTPPKPRDPAADCYEVNIAPADNPFPTASLVGRQKSPLPPPVDDGWHTILVLAQQGRFQIEVDGQTALAYTDPQWLGKGYIGLQHNQGAIAFRNLKLKPLGLKTIFNGRDLTGWKRYPEMKSRFTVTEEGELNVRDGRGQLETERSYGDFILQLDCISYGDQLNSGVFFRCIPGREMMGYESQIHNGYRDGDRSQPVDCGTGGIFRRVDARRVVSDDHRWFRKTLIADGPHIAVWVDGYPVTDWTDRRPPHENPRKGLRTAPGTIMLQGHDPTTNLSFRRLKIGEIPARWGKE